MRRILGVGVACAALAFGTAAVADDAVNDLPPGQQPTEPTASAPPSAVSTGEIQVKGIVGDTGDRDLTVLTPLGTSTTVDQLGGAVYVDREINLVALEGKVEKNAKVMRDGKETKFDDLDEGDFVRVSYDPKTHRFSQIEATSSDKYLGQK